MNDLNWQALRYIANEMNEVVWKADSKQDNVVVNLFDLARALHDSIKRLFHAMDKDTHLCLRVIGKSARFYKEMTFQMIR